MRIKRRQQNPPIDFLVALDRTGGDRSFLSELLILYLREFKKRFPKLKNAVSKENFNQIYALGHLLKGSSANLSLPLLEALSQQMEVAGYEKNIKKANTALTKLYSEYERLFYFVFPQRKTKLTKSA